MKVGDKVKYAQDDDGLIYEIVELNGDRGFMCPTNWKYGFAPTILFRVAEVATVQAHTGGICRKPQGATGGKQ